MSDIPVDATRPRIALVHALEQSVVPARAAFAEHWPGARTFDLLDTSLSADLAFNGGRLDGAMMRRFEVLGDYVAGNGGEGGPTAGILFTCSAFGPAIDAVKTRLSLPVLRPNEAAFEEALVLGSRIGLVVTYLPSQRALQEELEAMAAASGKTITVRSGLAEGALEALQAGNGSRHDTIIAGAAAALGEVDAVILGQFSAARAAPATRSLCDCPVISTPQSAVERLRRLIEGRA
tara:strand:+ start:6080 stop:6784 length:705 start_codon:yes stop_codon:yes gene_type:complete